MEFPNAASLKYIITPIFSLSSFRMMIYLNSFLFSTALLTTLQPHVDKIDALLRRAHGSTDRQYFRRLAAVANLPNDEAALFAKLLVRMKRKYRKRSLRKLTARDLKFNGK